MRKVVKWIFRALLALALAALVIGLWKREEITRLLAVNTLFDEDRIVSNFSNMDGAFLHREIPKGDTPISTLPIGAPLEMPDSYAGWVTDRTVTSTLVLKDGQIVHEAYYQGTAPDDLRISWSVAKSYLSALFGILVDEGAITSLDAPVTDYAPSLAGGAYDGATIRNVLQMTSGITFDEDYLDYDSDINRMGRVLALGGKMDDFAAGLTETFAPAGETWQYTSIDTHVVGMVARGATGRDIPDLMAEKLIGPLGLEQSPLYLTDGIGVAFVLGGLNITTRDYARFGQMILQNGTWQGQQIVPADWIAASTRPSAPTQPGKIGYGYQWWIPVGASEGQFMGRGIYGQYLYIDRQAGVVIVTTAADRKFREAGVSASNIDMFRQIVAATE
ncbi:beta-lactamase family protein [Tateyamaria omphalii]|uniref:serine hydrolase domain-containing protein n=1 Tax=Tateyamaria omphalii TaxID=299262 RepID=UPI001C99AF3D|nr:serine hydrolase [Tateyamaria omphalii]MBY5934264.1 beta-lactamase family protein [Tateyamaria omphalii]